jgi:hypothetical protein
MKLLIALLMMSSTAFAVGNISLKSQCFKIKDSIDRKYCQDKKANLLKKHYNKQANTWKKGLKKNDKINKQKALNNSIASKSEQLKMLQLELNLMKQNKAKLAKAKIHQPKRKKKKKNDVKSQIEKALNIKL